MAKILETLEQAVCGALGTKSVEVVGSQLSIAVSAADEMVSDDDQPPGYGNESFLAAGTSSNPVEQSDKYDRLQRVAAQAASHSALRTCGLPLRVLALFRFPALWQAPGHNPAQLARWSASGN